MRWTPGGESPDIEDRRSQGAGPGGGGGLGGLAPVLIGALLARRRMGLGGLILLLVVAFLSRHVLFNSQPEAPPRTNPSFGTASPGAGTASRAAGEDREVQFISFVLDDVQKTWDGLLPADRPYRHAKLVLFRDYTTSACGAAQSATGPFYCPVDEKVYLDLGFFDELANRLGAPGDFGQAYVIAHEIGHHVQKVLGIQEQVRRLQLANPSAANPLSVKTELQADCLAGVWGHFTQQRQIADSSDIAAGMEAVAAVGDDRLQRMARGHISPETFTHGSSAERTSWFRRGLESGGISSCNTFSQ